MTGISGRSTTVLVVAFVMVLAGCGGFSPDSEPLPARIARRQLRPLQLRIRRRGPGAHRQNEPRPRRDPLQPRRTKPPRSDARTSLNRLISRQYVAARVDTPSDHWRLFRNPPNTTEAIIHGLAPGAEPPAKLSMTVETDQDDNTDRETRGELFARTVLAAELPEERAARGAARWGNDVLVTLQTNDRQGFVWALRWDSADHVAEFMDTFWTAIHRRGERRDGYWVGEGAGIRVVRVAPQPTVVVTGPSAFVRGIRATGTNSSVSVTTDEESEKRVPLRESRPQTPPKQ